jgi:hypothetical protein
LVGYLWQSSTVQPVKNKRQIRYFIIPLTQYILISLTYA